MTLSDTQEELNRGHDFDFSGLKAVFINCSLKASHQGASHTQTLMDDAFAIMRQNGVAVTNLRAADHRLAFGVQPDMREHGASHDDWPEIFWPEIRDADILVLGTPIWLGEESSLCRVVIERLYAHSA
ncbi:MAG: NAD(P)H-dependent oxidoreductase, partial [Amphiplicatus sp.]